MKVPLNWLRDYVDINVDAKKYADLMTLSGSKVEAIENPGEEISGVVVGRIISVEKHPNADKLQVSRVDTGNGIVQVVTGATNIKAGDYIPVALVGAKLPGGIEIKKTNFRGVESDGMMCSISELGFTKYDFPEADEGGIFILKMENLVPGEDIRKVLDLDDYIVEFEITSNRPDCLSMAGIARESAATFRTGYKEQKITVQEKDEDFAASHIDVKIEDFDLCPRFCARVIKNVKIEPSPQWMRSRLRKAGIRPINNIVDITNYVMLEYGQPMHAYDLDYIRGNTIIVRRAEDGEEICTLDGTQRLLDSSMLVIADNEGPVGVAGVMGGANSEINSNTKTILFESANFNGTAVRLAAKKLGMRTEASGRFEKGLDMRNSLTAINRAAQLVEELGAGTVCKGVVDCSVKIPEERLIEFRPERINALLGTDISAEEMIGILKSVGIEPVDGNTKVKVPSSRIDIEQEADLAEEVARFYDYNNIEATLMSGKSSTMGGKSYKQKIEDFIKNTMIACGLSETFTFSFTSPKVLDKIRLPENSVLRKTVTISNPLGEDFSIMRTTTLPDMLEVISRNYNRRIEEAAFYELSYVYLPVSIPVNELPVEKEVLTIGMYGNYDFFDIKGIVEELMEVLGIKQYDFEPEANRSEYHPGRTANLVIGGRNVGIIGEIHPEVSENFNAPERVYIGMIEVEPLVEFSNMVSQYKPLPKYPAVSRDIAMIVRDEVTVRQIDGIIKKESGNILESAALFDVYKGKQIPEGKKSIAYRITFRADNRTLTDDEVNKVMGNILKQLKEQLDADLRE